jgi:hypothetical protein
MFNSVFTHRGSMNEIFGERSISRNLWPPRSPDLTPPDFSLWGAAKFAVCRDGQAHLMS